MASSLQLVHVSDLHIGAPTDWRSGIIRGLRAATDLTMRQLALSAARGVVAAQAANSVVHCVASGDLTTLGDRDEIERALTYLESWLALLRTGLEYGREGGVTHVLGNHDVWGGGLLRGSLRGARAKRRVVDDMGPEHAPRTLIGEDYYLGIGSLRVRIYVLDSTATGLANVFASGEVRRWDLRSLRAQVEKDQKDDRRSGARATLRIAVLHHPVEAVRPWYRGFVLKNRKEVLSTLRDLHFGVVLCGHDHDQKIKQITDGLVQCIAGSSCQGGRKSNSFLVFEIDGAAGMGDGTPVRISRFVRDARIEGGAFVRTKQETYEVSVAVLS